LKTNTKGSGKMERNMGRDLKYGRMEPSSKECMKMIKNVELDHYFWQMDLYIKENSKMGLFKGKVHMNGSMAGSIKVNGKIAKCMV
jgi:hypothetical protein